MPSVLHVFFCSLGALLFWSAIGFALSRRLVPATLALPIAPAFGWAVHSALALPLYRLIGFTPTMVAFGSLLFLAVALFLFFFPANDEDEAVTRVPPWAYTLAALLAVVPASALFAKFNGDVVAFAGPIVDHSKVALIDEMTRLGLPPGNSFFGPASHDQGLAYYYLWHFSAAELSLILGVTGWEADIALTAFTAFSSAALMMGFAAWIGRRVGAAVWVVPLAFAASLRPVLEAVFGDKNVYAIFRPQTGFAGWLFQTSWAPQHIASASCVLLASMLLLQLARRPSLLGLINLSLLVGAGYESSIWVGGIVFAVASPVMAAILLAHMPSDTRLRFVGTAIAAAIIAAVFAYPFLRDQFLNAAARGVGSPITFKPYSVLNSPDSDTVRGALDIPAYWLALLVIEFPAIYITGLISLASTLRRKLSSEPTLLMTRLLLVLTLTGLFIGGYFTLTFSDNNDLGWRSVLPSIFVLTIFAGTGLGRWLAAPSPFAAAMGLAFLLLALPGSIKLAADNWRGAPSHSGKDFAATETLWHAVRRYAGPAERIANNPLFMAEMTPWPTNISWALFANRASCFAGHGLVLPYSSLSSERLAAIDAQFQRVFDGRGNIDDVHDLAARFQCRVVVLTPHDGAWRRDPFASSGLYMLAEEKPDAWRIYRAK
jgi:hypothetical protein